MQGDLKSCEVVTLDPEADFSEARIEMSGKKIRLWTEEDGLFTRELLGYVPTKPIDMEYLLDRAAIYKLED